MTPNVADHLHKMTLSLMQRRRDKVLEFRRLFLDWIQRVCQEKGLPEEAVQVG